MGLQERPAPPFFQWVPAISATPRSFLAAILSLACILSLTVELPASAAIPAAARDKGGAGGGSETGARGWEAAKGQAAGGGDAEAPRQTAANAKQEMSDAPAPMKQEQPERNPAANGGKRRDVLGGGDPNNVPPAIADDSKRPQRVVAELGMAKLTRAIYSERQLQQVMDDFWFNHV